MSEDHYETHVIQAAVDERLFPKSEIFTAGKVSYKNNAPR